jgi:hypothetical protein
MASALGISYNDAAIKESLWDSIKDLDAINTYLTSNAGQVKVTQKLHSWVVDPIDTISALTTVLEGADTTYSVTDPTITSNSTEIIEKGFKVTGTDESSDHAGFKSRFAREQVKAMKLWKNQLEYDAIKGTLSTGSATVTARTMKGITGFAGNTSSVTSGSVTFDATELNKLLGQAWDDGAEIQTVLVGKGMKAKISAMTSPNTRNIEAKAAELVGRVDAYDSDFGRVKIVAHRYVTAGELVGYIDDYIKVGFLAEPHFEERPAAGYFKAGSIVGEGTLQVSHANAVLYAKTYAV